MTYTPRLDYAPLSKRPQEPTGLRSPTTTTTAAATTMVCGHSLEVNFSNDFSIFAGLEQVYLYVMCGRYKMPCTIALCHHISTI